MLEEVVARVKRVEARLAALRQTSETQLAMLQAAESRSADLIEVLLSLIATIEAAGSPAPAAPVDVRQLEDALAQRLVDGRLHVEAALDQMRTELESLRGAPITVDLRALEDAADRGSLRNAADIANLRQSIEGLADTVRAQGKGIGEVRTTIDWIKERLLLR